MKVVENQRAQFLLLIIQSLVRPSFNAHSDEWRFYRQIQGVKRIIPKDSGSLHQFCGTHQKCTYPQHWILLACWKTFIKNTRLPTKTIALVQSKNMSILIDRILLGMSIYSTNNELLRDVSSWGERLIIWSVRGEIVYLVQNNILHPVYLIKIFGLICHAIVSSFIRI